MKKLFLVCVILQSMRAIGAAPAATAEVAKLTAACATNAIGSCVELVVRCVESNDNDACLSLSSLCKKNSSPYACAALGMACQEKNTPSCIELLEICPNQDKGVACKLAHQIAKELQTRCYQGNYQMDGRQHSCMALSTACFRGSKLACDYTKELNTKFLDGCKAGNIFSCLSLDAICRYDELHEACKKLAELCTDDKNMYACLFTSLS